MIRVNLSPRPAIGQPHRQAGFSLVEMLVALAAMTEVMVVVLVLFDLNDRMARVETQTSEMQQSQRISQQEVVRLVRMAGRGGLQHAQAIEVTSNAADDAKIGDSDSPDVEEGTDVLTLRGVYTSPVFFAKFDDETSFSLDEGAKVGTIKLESVSPTDFPQPLDVFKEMTEGDFSANNPRPEALLLVTPTSPDVYAVVQVKSVQQEDDWAKATITFSIDPDFGKNASYLAMSCCGSTSSSPAFPSQMTNVWSVGVLEEYRMYVRATTLVEDRPDTEETTRLSRARFYPNTDDPWDGEQDNLTVDIADFVTDLQVALAIDADRSGTIAKNDDLTADEWLFNTLLGSDPEERTGPFETAPVHWVRITTVARSSRPVRDYVAPPIDLIEDRVYDELELPSFADVDVRRYRRRQLTTTVDLRNL